VRKLGRNFYDLHVHFNEEIEETIEIAKRLGWKGICITEYFEGKKSERKFLDFTKKIDEIKRRNLSKKGKEIEILIGAEIKEDIRKNSRDALNFSDIIIVHGGNEKINREASECWEVDILAHPEISTGKDFMNQKNSGIDHIIAKLLKEKVIAIEINFSELLNASAALRAQKIGRICQNIILARKYGVPIIITSGAKSKYELRSPKDLLSLGKLIGMSDLEAKKSLEENPLKILKKSKDRKNPNILLKGLEVLNWGNQEKRKKKMYGFY